jgi:MoaA/NifB/PqqE/SkfB family radical SAM enzyme
MNPLRLALAVVANRTGRVPRPGWCTYLVTFRCNARCGMCDSWRMKPGPELTPDQVRYVFGKIGRLDVVRLTGGEPFLREDFAEIAGFVDEQSRPGVLHITTNGSYPDRVALFATRFRRPDRLRFMVSVDGLPEEHDANRGEDVTFSLVEETVRRLVELRSRLGLAVSINHTIISERSLRDHETLVAHFAALGVDVHHVLAYSDSAMYGLKRFGKKAADLIPETGYPLHPDIPFDAAIDFVAGQMRDGGRLRDPLLRRGKKYYLRGLLARLKKQPRPDPRPRCVALRSHLRLLPDGRVPVCQFNTETVGNLLTQSFEDVWHGDAARPARQWVDGCSGCWAECEVMPSAIYTGDVLVG